MTIRPVFYSRFRCKASACRHTCCAGWEIDVDEDSARFYKTVKGAFGDKLRENILTENGVSLFRLREDKRCPFLQDDGLCEMILNLGEESLCEICREHPRFYETIGDAELQGLGMSCEASAELLLSEKDLLSFAIEDDEGTEDSNLLSLCQTLKIPMTESQGRFDAAFGERLLAARFDALSGCETMDEAWARLLLDVKTKTPDAEAFDGVVFQNIYQYIFYRQLEWWEDYGVEALFRYAAFSTALIRRLILSGTPPVTVLMHWSEEIEYSTENVEILLKALLP